VLAGILDDDQLIIISTHQVRDVENLIDKILILDKGEVIFHKTIEDISQKVCFISGTSAEAEGAIYSEMIPGGHRLMVPKGSSETEVDIELLFNAITKGKKIE
jgi:ABC-2 type transport system ATP-binding protein